MTISSMQVSMETMSNGRDRRSREGGGGGGELSSAIAVVYFNFTCSRKVSSSYII